MNKNILSGLMSGLFLSTSCFCAENHFNPAFLSSDPEAVADLGAFETGAMQPPGVYKVDVYINDSFMATRPVTFDALPRDDKASADSDSGLTPVFTSAELAELGIKTQAFPAIMTLPAAKRISLEKAIPDAVATPEMGALRLKLSVPQAALVNNARGYIPPSRWDQGINALLLNYNLTGNKDWYDSGTAQSQFLSLQDGLNLGAWRLRDNSTWNHNTYTSGETSSEWQHISTYVERNIAALKGELTAGDTSSRGDVFDSYTLRGMKLESDDNMLPDSQKGFAPTIRGIAGSNAKVTIRQNNYTIYQTYVPAGAFEINDLFPTSSSGDLQVTVTETSGRSQTYTIPYSSVPGLQREGHISYSLSAGRYHSGSDMQDEPDVIQGEAFWGLAGVTLYGGAQFTDNYQSFALGVGKNMGDIGAVSVDITNANSTLSDGSSHTGQSVRFLYAKSLNALGTTFNLTGYRYSTEGYYSLSDTTYKIMSGYNSPQDNSLDDLDNDDEPDYASYYNLWYTKKGKLQLSINQSLGDYGSLYVSGTQQTYWHTDEEDTYFQSGYSGAIRDLSFNLSYSYNRYMSQPEPDQMFALNISLPIGKWLSPPTGDIHHMSNDAYLSYNNNTDSHGYTTQSMGLSGTLLDDHNLSYSVQQGYGNHGAGNSGNASLTWRETYNNLNLGYNYNDDSRQVNYGVSGGMVLHGSGLTLSQPLGDTNILVAAPGASGIGLENSTGVKTDWRGYAVIPYASTYRVNRVALDANSLDKHTDIEDMETDVIPTPGALVRADFNAHVGGRILMTILHQGKPLPFGSMVTRQDEGQANNQASIVGDGGEVYLTGLPQEGELVSSWGAGKSQKCIVHYVLPDDAMEQTISNVRGVCL
ncbi:fimbrial biogenesis usher protein [Citrobacter werkmanii]|uniref:fimbrial biogenesis usher protein n=1 Tax=Citrobacter werkmanii TaxID=67827 RepID=UPI0026564D36|nr:fimbrial biogenesis usher protein [Citrobacter werkmanii]MDN8559084.1 fimbrial biogenesis usher protein [Citrobacter werkmanii]